MDFLPLETDRLRLRLVEPSDAEALAARRSEPEVARYQDWRAPFSIDLAQAISHTPQSTDIKDGVWRMITVVDRLDGRILGDLALQFRFEGRVAELGYTFASSNWGHGYAIEAVLALMEKLFGLPMMNRVQASLHPDNLASARVLERAGFHFEGHRRLSFWDQGESSDGWFYGLTRGDWDAWSRRTRAPAVAVELVELSPDNDARVRALRTHKSQERLVSPVTDSLADALIPEVVEGHPVTPWFRAVVADTVEADTEIVGFVMLALATEHHAHPYLWRLLIDRSHQHRGIGSQTLDLVVEECRRRGSTILLTSWVDGRGSPRKFYEAFGFEPTGRVVDGEIEASLTLAG